MPVVDSDLPCEWADPKRVQPAEELAFVRPDRLVLEALWATPRGEEPLNEMSPCANSSGQIIGIPSYENEDQC